MPKRVLLVATNVDRYLTAPQHRTGLWLSELTHAWDVFAAHGFTQQIVSPLGGLVPLEPRSLRFPLLDKSARNWLHNPARMALLADTPAAAAVNAADFDAIYFTGGHAVMFDFPQNSDLQRLTREIYEAGGVVGAVCHGYCALLETRLSDGSHLLAGRNITGFAWREEQLAGVAKLVPYNAEARTRKLGANYQKARLPFVSHVVRDGRLITGQNPGSALATARAVAARLA